MFGAPGSTQSGANYIKSYEEGDHWHSAPPDGIQHGGYGGPGQARDLTCTSGNRSREIRNPGRGAPGPERGNPPGGPEAGPAI